MSFTTDAPAAPAAEAPQAPVTTDAGTPTTAPVAAETGATAAPSTEPVAAPSGDLHTVKVDGEEVQVTLDELRNGYSRQADYTRKTQALKEREKDLQAAASLMAAFERDPHATLTALADAYDWTPQQMAAAGAELEAQSQSQEPVDPFEQRLSRIEQFTAAQERQAVQAQIDEHLSFLRTNYGEFDQDAVVNHAIAKGVDLITAYKDLTFDQVRQQQAANQAAVEAKRAAQVVEGGQTTQPGAVSAPPAPMSLRDTIRAAVQAAGS